MASVNVKKAIVNESTPSEDGEALGAYIAREKLGLAGLVLDMTDLAPEDLVSSFVNAFLNYLEQKKVDVKNAARITWKTKFPGETTRLREMVKLYLEDARN